MAYRDDLCLMLGRHCDLASSTILEVGSDDNLNGASILSRLGARLVIASNLGARWAKVNPPPRVVLQNSSDATRLAVGDESIDAIIGTAVLEHISGLSEALAEFNRVLKPGGVICIHGGPLWNCGKGHHVWLTNETRSYRFNDDQSDPVPLWGHLLYDQTGLREHLLGSGLNYEDSLKISEWIFGTSDLSRITYAEIMRLVSKSGFNMIEKIEYAWHKPDSKTVEAIRARNNFPEDERFDISDLRLILQKPL